MRQLSIRQLLVTLIPAGGLLTLIALVAILRDVPMADITRDVAAIAGINPLAGVISSLGIMAWCATAAICLFAAALVRSGGPRDTTLFLAGTALISLYLMADDLFQFHETLAPRYLHLRERYVFVLLGAALLAYLLLSRRVILRSRYGMLVVAVGLLAASLGIDLVSEKWLSALGDWEYLLEDGVKWLGITSWLSYHAEFAYRAVVDTLAARSTS